ncbi:hypothetical protein CAP36_13230 [Chitinophagaceae bacterium IBVUCB2]|nr:hypothetical protein CAP36_13230 [Chitinophagaceae bacterium IBVUCB2]
MEKSVTKADQKKPSIKIFDIYTATAVREWKPHLKKLIATGAIYCDFVNNCRLKKMLFKNFVLFFY